MQDLLNFSAIQPYQFTPISIYEHNLQTNQQVSNLQHEKHQPTTSPLPGMEKTSGVDSDFFKSFS